VALKDERQSFQRIQSVMPVLWRDIGNACDFRRLCAREGVSHCKPKFLCNEELSLNTISYRSNICDLKPGFTILWENLWVNNRQATQRLADRPHMNSSSPTHKQRRPIAIGTLKIRRMAAVPVPLHRRPPSGHSSAKPCLRRLKPKLDRSKVTIFRLIL
jgi:hypothetical protein